MTDFKVGTQEPDRGQIVSLFMKTFGGQSTLTDGDGERFAAFLAGHCVDRCMTFEEARLWAVHMLWMLDLDGGEVIQSLNPSRGSEEEH